MQQISNTPITYNSNLCYKFNIIANVQGNKFVYLALDFPHNKQNKIEKLPHILYSFLLGIYF
jgi:hypothetical protein